MKKLLLLCAVSFIISGCGGMTNDEIIAETDKCKAAGMCSYQIQSGLMWDVRKVVCCPCNED